MGRGEWMKLQMLKERQKRCLQRAWTRRDAKIRKTFA